MLTDLERKREAEQKELQDKRVRQYESEQARDQAARSEQAKQQQQQEERRRQREEKLQKLQEAQREQEERRTARLEEKQRLQQQLTGAFTARQRSNMDKMHSLHKELEAKRLEARVSSDQMKERRRSEVEHKARSKSEKLEGLESDRQKLWELRKNAHREAQKILRTAKAEVQKQAASSRYSVKWLEDQVGRLEADARTSMAPVDKNLDGKVPLSLCQMLETEKTASALKASAEDEELPAPKKSFQPYHAQSVPKSEDLEAVAFSRQSSGDAGDVTTMMLRNIPNKYTQNSLLQEINDMGFSGTFNFFYLPMDVHNRSNVGYAFINFLRPDDAELFRSKFSDHRFQRFQSRKISSVCTAHVQGLHENLRHFQNRAVTHARNDQYRPVVFRNGSRVDIEEILAEAKNTPSNSEDEAKKAKAKEPERKAKVPEAKRAPKARAQNGRKGLEDAIRQSLEALQERMAQSSQDAPPPPPGLTPPFDAASGTAGAMGGGPESQEVRQLLNLRGLLLDRLLHKEEF
ncbi:unnamed protein product [Effrenium voratum]|nr:unnamed protein product [Effrenium voratum]